MLKKIAIGIAVVLLLGGIGVMVGDRNDSRSAKPRQAAPAEGVNTPDADGKTPLQQAILAGEHSKFLALLRDGADPNAIGWHGNAAMHLAAAHDESFYLEKLMAHGGDPNVAARRLKRSPIFLALDSRRPKNRDLLIAHGANIEYADSSGKRPLKHAADINDAESVLYLLEQGADPAATDDLGSTFQSSFFRGNPELLNWETRRRYRKVIAILESKGVPLDPRAERFR